MLIIVILKNIFSNRYNIEINNYILTPGKDRSQHGGQSLPEVQGEHVHQLGAGRAVRRHQGHRGHCAGGSQDRGRVVGHPQEVGGAQVCSHEGTGRAELTEVDHHQSGDRALVDR